MSWPTWQTTSPLRSPNDKPIVIRRRSHDALHESGLKFEAWTFLEYCRLFPSRIVDPTPNEWIGLNLLYRDRELTDAFFKSRYYVNTEE